jgi:hypothetical protein
LAVIDKHLLLRVDLCFALSSGSRPLFFSDGMSWEPYLAQKGQPLKSVSIPPLLSQLDRRLVNIWLDLQEFCTSLNLAFRKYMKLDQNLFQEMTVSVIYRLLHLDYSNVDYDGQDNDFSDTVHEAIRLAILGFATTIFLQISNVDMGYTYLASKLEMALRALEKPIDPDEWQLRVWLLSVAEISVLRGQDTSWLEMSLVEGLHVLEVTSWLEAKQALQVYLWVDTMHNQAGKELYARCMAISHEA